MIKAVLLDLDETLLHNPPDTFAKAYIMALVSYMQRHHPSLDSTLLLNSIRHATHATITSQNALQFNADVFYDTLCAAIGIQRTEMEPPVANFLRDTYPLLQSKTQPNRVAPALVDWLLAKNYAVAIATNPLFPHSAVVQRLKWAGIDAERIWFISTLDNVHFTKPNPAYYEEIMTRLGFEPDETVMIGDDWDNDIVPAARAGFSTYWIRPASTPKPTNTGNIMVQGVGSLADLWHAIQHEGWIETLTPQPLTPQQIIPRFLGNIAALHGFTREIPDHFWTQHPDPSEWSPLEIVVHLLESERNVQRPRIEMILTQDNPFLVNPPPPPPPYRTDLADVDGDQAVQQFAEERLHTIECLTALTDEQWIRPARHSVFGPTSLLEMAAFTARHDRLHINQLCQTLGKCL